MIEHVIAERENLEIIARKYKTTVKEIIEDNKINNRTRLGIGNKIKIRDIKTEEAKDKK